MLPNTTGDGDVDEDDDMRQVRTKQQDLFQRQKPQTMTEDADDEMRDSVICSW